MLQTMTRFLKALWYTITFRAHEKADKLMQNPMVVHAIYEDIINEKQDKLIRYKKGVEWLTNLIDLKRNSLEGLTQDINNIEKLKERAITVQNNKVAEMENAGTSVEEIQQHPSYLRCITAINNYQSILDKKYTFLDKLKKDIEQRQTDIESITQQLTHSQNDLDIIKQEQSEYVAELIREREQEEIDIMLSGMKVEGIPKNENL